MKRFDPASALQWFFLMRQGSAILTGVLLVQFGLPVADVGAYEILQYIGFLFSVFWVTGLSQALLSYFPTLAAEQQRRLIGSAYLVFTGVSTLLFVLLWVSEGITVPLLASRPTLPWYHLFLWWQLFNLPAYLIENIYLLHRKANAIFWFGVGSFGLQLLAVLVPVAMGAGLVWSFYSLIALGVLKFVWLSSVVWQHGQLVWEQSLVRKWVHIAWPLALYSILGSILVSFSFWLVGYLYSDDEATFAIFRYGAREFPLVIALTNGLSAAMIPVLAKDLQAGLPELKARSLRLFHLLFPLSILLMLTSGYIFPLVFSETFAESALVFNAFLLITVTRVLFPRAVLMALQSNRIGLISSLTELVILIAASTLLAPWFGLTGIALGAALSNSMEKVILCTYLHRRFGIALSQYADLKWWAGYSVALVAAFLWSVLWG